MVIIEIRYNADTYEKELYLYGEFQASWDRHIDDMKYIIPFAIERAIEIGKEQKIKEIKRALNL